MSLIEKVLLLRFFLLQLAKLWGGGSTEIPNWKRKSFQILETPSRKRRRESKQKRWKEFSLFPPRGFNL